MKHSEEIRGKKIKGKKMEIFHIHTTIFDEKSKQ